MGNIKEIQKAKTDVNYINFKAIKEYNESTRKLVRNQNIEIENLRKMVLQQKDELSIFTTQLITLRLKIFNTGSTSM